MLSAAFAAILAAAIPTPIAGSPPPLPPMTIRVGVAPGITPTLVAGVLAEADAIWRGAGVTFRWQPDDEMVRLKADATSIRPDGAPVFEPFTLHVSIGFETNQAGETHFPLGWIVFDDPSTPRQEISVSYANAMTLLERSSGVVGVAATMPRMQRELLLSRAMGRALAHEVGHYLLAS